MSSWDVVFTVITSILVAFIAVTWHVILTHRPKHFDGSENA